MDFADVIRTRRSVRVFKDTPVEEPVVREMIALASRAPSPMNIQPWHFHVATGKSRDRVCEVVSRTTQYLEEYLDVLGEEGIEHAAHFYANLGGAPVIIGISAPRVPEHDIDDLNTCLAVGACIENLLLAATDRGLGACNITVPRWVAEDVLAAFDVPADRRLMSIVVLGEPDEAPAAHAHPDSLTSYQR